MVVLKLELQISHSQLHRSKNIHSHRMTKGPFHILSQYPFGVLQPMLPHCFQFLNFLKIFARLWMKLISARLQHSRNYLGKTQKVFVLSLETSHSPELQYMRCSSADLLSIYYTKNGNALIKHPAVINKCSRFDFKDHLRD